MRKAIILAFLVALVGCAGDAQTRATASLAVSCEAYATALERVTIKKPLLAKETVARVDAMNSIAKPICGSDSVVDPAAAVAVVQDIVKKLQLIGG